MPFKTFSKDLPSRIKSLSLQKRKVWVGIFNSVFETDGEKLAFIAANTWLLKEAKKEKKELMARSEKTRIIKLELQKEDGKFIKRSDDGEDYVSFLLQDVNGDNDGVTYTPEVLQKWADQINAGDIVKGDINHLAFDEALLSSVQEKTIKDKLRGKPSIAKAVKAIFENGKLWVRAVIDKRYRNKIDESNGVSLEALTISDEETNMVHGGELLGFSFMVGAEQANPRAVVSA